MPKVVGRLESTRNIDVEEMVVILLQILVQDVKNRVIKKQFMNLETISRQFSNLPLAMIRYYKELLTIPKNSSDLKWKWFNVTIILLILVINI